MLKIVILALLIPSICFGACPNNVQTIKQGSQAVCDGWLVSDNQMQTFAKTTDELDLEKKAHELNKRLRTLDQVEIEFYRNKYHNSVKNYDKLESSKFWTNIGFFALGVVLTGISAKAAIEASK